MCTVLLCFIVVFAAILISFLMIAYHIKTGCPSLPSSKKSTLAIISLIDKNICGTILELGSGFGGLALAVAKNHPNCKIIGYEISLVPFLVAKLRSYFAKNKNIAFVWTDFFKEDLDRVELIVCYLTPNIMERLKAKLLSDLTTHPYIITNFFSFRGWVPQKIHEVRDMYLSKIFVYKFIKTQS